ncbi:cob(I)yrinic acid a,c-diamide adenosyltransferase [Microbacterium sp. APC 3898]|uniref:Corrinoid adenosyltransferase n=2 Tax=Planococcus TaxID=1372 RepID=A0ABT7ZL26_9BACL|nr:MULTISPECIES: cob(I)yrinic acid a,c-diamide adenosyltransferase [Terrabacteria group]MBD8013267.1 cob(I)yrinic acid a,c-diamide adenosyltransferase [Planococcus wigleyi]MDN3427844.1 cob(I)yrinic acid a,c-diamide adenosyltransferase [Planococcus sp. APC 4016]MDN3437198.1 cob(I)yrinic acid a,c-diamide adenosyltransferase [Planococcus sp. APC 3900]MDN3499396.1 cob(I)yrinic acid a,c-diamide adenosyltransferase [Microbacterium sp. APC 3898]
MKIYTKTGDKGQTSLIGARTDKDAPRVEAYGTIDEVNSFIGKAMTELAPDLYADLLADLEAIQNELFDCGGDLADVRKEPNYKMTEEPVEVLEKRIDELMEEPPLLERFILPGGSPAAATMHIARTITRRAERQTVTLMRAGEDFPPVVQRYLNRLSDYLFAAARVVNSRAGVPDNEYVRSAKVFKNGGRSKKSVE